MLSSITFFFGGGGGVNVTNAYTLLYMFKMYNCEILILKVSVTENILKAFLKAPKAFS